MARNVAVSSSTLPARSLRLSGFRPFSALNRDIARLFDELVQSPLGATPVEQAPLDAQAIMSPQINVSETKSEIRVTAELPGVDPDKLEVDVIDDMLMIRGEKAFEREADDENFHVLERTYGAFQRNLQLPFNPPSDQVRANFENGVLTVVIPKSEQQQRMRRIEVRSGSSAQGQSQDGRRQAEASRTQPSARPKSASARQSEDAGSQSRESESNPAS
jgi:HSP20 family protein